jgi:fatty acid desaturase
MTDATLYPIPVRRNLCIIVVEVGLFFAIVQGAARVDAWWQVALLALAFAVVGNAIYAVIHEAEHGMLHPDRRINDWLGASLAVLFPAPYHLIRQGHLGHHRRNRSDDEAFDCYFDGDRPWLKWLVLYGIITGGYWILVVCSNVLVLIAPFLFKKRHFDFDRPSAAFMEALDPRLFRLIQIEGAAAIAFHVFILWFFDVEPLVYAAVYFGFGFSWSAMQYVHHYGTERDVVDGARNLRFFQWIDAVWLNHNWHLVHHRQPTVPWVYLPSLGCEAKATRESLVWHYLRMWRGPRYTTTRVPAPGRDAAGEPAAR